MWWFNNLFYSWLQTFYHTLRNHSQKQKKNKIQTKDKIEPQHIKLMHFNQDMFSDR